MHTIKPTPQERIGALRSAGEFAILVLRQLQEELKERDPDWAKLAGDAQAVLSNAVNDTDGLDR